MLLDLFVVMLVLFSSIAARRPAAPGTYAYSLPDMNVRSYSALKYLLMYQYKSNSVVWWTRFPPGEPTEPSFEVPVLRRRPSFHSRFGRSSADLCAKDRQYPLGGLGRLPAICLRHNCEMAVRVR